MHHTHTKTWTITLKHQEAMDILLEKFPLLPRGDGYEIRLIGFSEPNMDTGMNEITLTIRSTHTERVKS